jgi:NADPH2:quinone reductase
MKAAWYSRNGEAQDVMQVGDLPTPSPQAGEVLVRLATSGVNPSDVKSRRARPVNDPLIVPHSDGAGVIEAVGEGVPGSRVGERVWLWNGQWQRPMGTCAQYIALPVAQAVALPEGVDFAAGACMGIPGLTAVQAVILAERLSGDLRGQTVLVTGASSAVGHYITQMVTQAGGRVIGTVGSEAKAAHARSAAARARAGQVPASRARAGAAETGQRARIFGTMKNVQAARRTETVRPLGGRGLPARPHSGRHRES